MGDFCQMPPAAYLDTINEDLSHYEQISSSIKQSDLYWDYFIRYNLNAQARFGRNIPFATMLGTIARGLTPHEESVPIPAHCVVNSIEDLLRWCSFNNPPENEEASWQTLSNAIICGNQTTADAINYEALMSWINTPEEISEAPIFIPKDSGVQRDLAERIGLPEALRRCQNFSAPGMAPSRLILKKLCPLMVYKNMDIPLRITNGGPLLRLINVDRHLLHCERLDVNETTGEESVTFIPIPRFRFVYNTRRDGEDPGMRFVRYQFPVQVAFAFTSYRAQAKTLSRIGICIGNGGSQIKRHGQLYTILSRVTSMNNLSLYQPINTGEATYTVTNLVLDQLIREYPIPPPQIHPAQISISNSNPPSQPSSSPSSSSSDDSPPSDIDLPDVESELSFNEQTIPSDENGNNTFYLHLIYFTPNLLR